MMRVFLALFLFAAHLPAMAFTTALIGASFMDCPSYCAGGLSTTTHLAALHAQGGNNFVPRAHAGDLADDLYAESRELLDRYYMPGFQQPDYLVVADTGSMVFEPAHFLTTVDTIIDDWAQTAPGTQIVLVMPPHPDGVIWWFWDVHNRAQYETLRNGYRVWGESRGALVVDAFEMWRSSGEVHPMYTDGDYHLDAQSREVAAVTLYLALIKHRMRAAVSSR